MKINLFLIGVLISFTTINIFGQEATSGTTGVNNENWKIYGGNNEGAENSTLFLGGLQSPYFGNIDINAGFSYQNEKGGHISMLAHKDFIFSLSSYQTGGRFIFKKNNNGGNTPVKFGIGASDPKFTLHLDNLADNDGIKIGTKGMLRQGSKTDNKLILESGISPYGESASITLHTPSSTQPADIDIIAYSGNAEGSINMDAFAGINIDSGNMPISLNSNANHILLQHKIQWNNVGIGTTNPTEKLDVNGNINSSGFTKANSFTMDSGNTDLRIYRDSDVGDWSLLRTNKGNGIGLIGQPDVVALSVSRTNSTVGIGTTNTKGFKLGVNGKIAATEVKVAVYDNWSDFVFKKDYDLPTLKEVEKHIAEKGHLENIPSAKEVAKDGFFLGAMDAKLLQKIEELTLYTIQQEKEIQKMKSEILSFKKLEKELQDIKEALKKR